MLGHMTALHHRHLVTWVLIADGRTAQLYQYESTARIIPLKGRQKHDAAEQRDGHTLLPVKDGRLNAESMDDYQIGHDRRGETSGSNSPTHNTYEPHGNIKEELKRRFTKTIARKLEKAWEEKLFDHLILAAPAKMIGELREQLTAKVQERISAALPKDLTHYQAAELAVHLQVTLSETKAA